MRFVLSTSLVVLMMVVVVSPISAQTTPVPWGEAEPILVTSPTSGEPNALWSDGGRIWHAVEMSNQSWSAPVPIARGELRSQGVTFGPDGTLHVGYASEFQGNWEGFYIKLPRGGSWTLPRNISHTTWETREVALAVSPDETIHTTWADSTPTGWVIYSGEECLVEALDHFCGAPVPSSQGGRLPDVIAESEGNWVTWVANGLILLHRPGVNLAYHVASTPPISNLRLEKRHEGGVIVFWAVFSREVWVREGDLVMGEQLSPRSWIPLIR